MIRNNIKKARIWRGITQKHFAFLMSMSVSQLQYYESNRLYKRSKNHMQIIVRASEVLNMDIKLLIAGKEDE